jgi:hypothetical protein
VWFKPGVQIEHVCRFSDLVTSLYFDFDPFYEHNFSHALWDITCLSSMISTKLIYSACVYMKFMWVYMCAVA